MEKIKHYELQDAIIDFDTSNVGFQHAEDEVTGDAVEILWIKYDGNNESIVKRIVNSIKDLIDSQIDGMQKIIKIDEDDENDCWFIIYEVLEVDEEGANICNKNNFEECVHILDRLKKTNRDGFLLNQDTIIKNTDAKIKLRFIGLFELFQKNIIPYSEDTSQKRKVKDDIKQLALFFEEYLEQAGYVGQDIYQKCDDAEYHNYIELQKDLEELPYQTNPDWACFEIAVNPDKYNIDDVVDEFKRGCWYDIKKELSEDNEYQISWSTRQSSGKAIIRNQQMGGSILFIRYIEYSPKEAILAKGEKLLLNFENGMHENEGYSDEFFEEKYSKNNELARLNNNKKEKTDTWKALPESEKKYIEEQAFKAKYIKREPSKNNHENIKFTLEDEFKAWTSIKDKKNNKIILSVNDEKIGKILDYKQEQNLLIIKDYQGDIASIPQQGILIEDVQQETSQYKKQVEACDKFLKKDIINPDLSGFIATPEKMPAKGYINIDYDEFDGKIVNSNLNNDETQKQAVIKALHMKPVFLIQGPPGTGKTTVIVELIEQIIKEKKHAKILVASQSNMAVDNVLQRIPEHILFMRLASEDAVKKENIIPEIKEHLFQEKLKHWIKITQKNSKEYFSKKFSNSEPALHQLFSDYSSEKQSIKNLQDFQKLYRAKGAYKNYFERIFGQAKNIQQIEPIFYEALGKDYIELQKIHKEWLAFINNATSQKGGSKLSTIRHGSEMIDLQTSFAMSMNVLGSTCIHIASAKYSKIAFKFDVMIMDEASKATSAEALVPINMAKNIILIGDHKQLPPVITREDAVKKDVKKKLEDEGLDIDKTYGKSLFEALFETFEQSNELAKYQIMLNIQYRMPRQLGYLISKHIYKGELENPKLEKLPDYDSDKAHHLPLKKSLVSIKEKSKDIEVPNSIIFISTSSQGNPHDNDNKYNRINQCNIEVIKHTLKTLCKVSKHKEIGVIAAYRGQVEAMKRNIKLEQYGGLEIDINTVDKFQGSERDIIIYDIVKSSQGNSNIGFLDDYRRVNVAFSRARKLLIVIGDSDYLLHRAKPNPSSKIKESDLVLKNITQELKDWGCIYHSIEEALQNDAS